MEGGLLGFVLDKFSSVKVEAVLGCFSTFKSIGYLQISLFEISGFKHDFSGTTKRYIRHGKCLLLCDFKVNMMNLHSVVSGLDFEDNLNSTNCTFQVYMPTGATQRVAT